MVGASGFSAGRFDTMVRAQLKHSVIRGKPHDERRGRGGERGKSRLKIKLRRNNKTSYRPKKKALSVGDGEALDCCVLLTRLEEKGVMGKQKERDAPKRAKSVNKKRQSRFFRRSTKSDKSVKRIISNASNHSPQPNISQSDALFTLTPLIVEPRQRRMAALNAEAVNSLLLYREDPLTSNRVKKQQHLANSKANDSLGKDTTVPMDGHKTKNVPMGGTMDPNGQHTKKKRSKKQAESIDWLKLLTPTPRRQAGLTAATLMKLTSAPYGSKRQRKAECKPGSGALTATQTRVTGEPGCGGTMESRTTSPQHGKNEKKVVEDLVHPTLHPKVHTCCCLCKGEPESPWRPATPAQQCDLPCTSALGFSVKSIKEEKAEVDVEVSPCYCCSQERCVEYCHRLALFLDDKSFKEAEEGSLSPVFHHHHHHHHYHHHHHHHHHLQPSHSVAHAPAVTISPHMYPRCPGYYVRFSRRDASPPSIPAKMLCPRAGQGPEPAAGASPHPSGISRPLYCCTTVAPCYADACRVSDYPAYPGVVPNIANRGCSIGSTDCSKCTVGATKGLHHSPPPSAPISPGPRSLTGCPVPAAPPAGQSVPRCKQAPLSDPTRPQRPLQVARECPQSAKVPSGSRSGARGGGGGGEGPRALCPLNREKKKKQQLGSAKAGEPAVAKQARNGRQRATNGWQPVGCPFDKEVFTVGEETPVRRTCFEAVQRDEEVIRVRDTVLLKSGPRKKSLPYVAKISSLWEDPESGEMMMSLFWYYRPEHTQGGLSPSMHCENEIFASRHQDVNSVACIEDKCYVLTLAQYCRFCALVKCRKEGVNDSATSIVVPPVVGHAMPAHRCVPENVDPDLVFVCRHVYDFRYGRLLKNLQ